MSSMTAPRPEGTGQTMVDRFRRIRLLGTGTFGQCWLVASKSSSKPYALKEVQVDGPKEMAAARAEVEVQNRLRHRHIVRLRSYSCTEHMLYLIMEYADGGDVDQRIKTAVRSRRSFPEQTVLRWTGQTCSALAYIHSLGILHRDVKPTNLFLTSADDIKLGDFGVSRILDKDDGQPAHLRRCTTPIGTPMYLPPEVLQGKSYGSSADMWALGCTVYEMMVLVPAFQASNLQALMRRIRAGLYSHLFPLHFSSDAKAMVQSMLTLTSDERPTALAVLDLPVVAAAVRDVAASEIRPPPSKRSSALGLASGSLRSKSYVSGRERRDGPSLLAGHAEGRAGLRPSLDNHGPFLGRHDESPRNSPRTSPKLTRIKVSAQRSLVDFSRPTRQPHVPLPAENIRKSRSLDSMGLEMPGRPVRCDPRLGAHKMVLPCIVGRPLVPLPNGEDGRCARPP